jgi:hypothetical protein
MNEKEIQNIFQPIIQQFVWGAKQGYGSFLSLEFGNPKTELGAIHKPSEKGKFPFNEFEHRNVSIKGDYTFFIYMSNWKIYANKIELAYDESERDEIEFALGFINGQKLINIVIDSQKNITELEFDLGGIVKISNENYEDEINEMWNFYTKSDKVLTYRNDRKSSYEKVETELENEKFTKINGKITCPNTRL